MMDLRDRAWLGWVKPPAGLVVPGLRLQNFQHYGYENVLWFREKGLESREILVRLDLKWNTDWPPSGFESIGSPVFAQFGK
jgi:hypothetical protein